MKAKKAITNISNCLDNVRQDVYVLAACFLLYLSVFTKDLGQ